MIFFEFHEFIYDKYVFSYVYIGLRNEEKKTSRSSNAEKKCNEKWNGNLSILQAPLSKFQTIKQLNWLQFTLCFIKVNCNQFSSVFGMNKNSVTQNINLMLSIHFPKKTVKNLSVGKLCDHFPNYQVDTHSFRGVKSSVILHEWRNNTNDTEEVCILLFSPLVIFLLFM